jgi:phosphoribosylformylglycinamidine synthase subunit PurQ / glutaminase
MKLGVVQLPGSCDDRDALHAARRFAETELLWHSERDLKGVDGVIIPGGFSYGDYLRAGAIARFAPVMDSVLEWAREGGRVLGICNGFQVLCEAHLLPGALLPNVNLRFTCREVHLDVVNPETDFTCACRTGGRALAIPAKHAWGRYYADEPTLSAMERSGQVVLKYARGHNFNGSLADIAGVCNEQGNVFGLMPHPEHAVDELTGSIGGRCFFESMRMAIDASAQSRSQGRG